MTTTKAGAHTQGRIEAFHNAGPVMQGYQQSSGLHGTGDNRLKLIAGCFKDIGGEEVAAANARRLAACWNFCEGVDTDVLETQASLMQRIDGYANSMAEMAVERDRAVRELAAARALLAEILAADDEYIKELEESGFPQTEWTMTNRIREFLKGQK